MTISSATIRATCDVCGKPIYGIVHRLVPYTVSASGKLIPDYDHIDLGRLDLCTSCFEKAARLIRKRGKVQQEPVSDVAHNAIALDMGKVRALRRAGWSERKIADEFSLTMEEYEDKLKK